MNSDDSSQPVLGTINHLIDPALDALFVNAPRSNVPSAWYGHVPFAFWLMRALQPRIVVELGTHNGVSYASFCQSAVDASIQTQCYAVDTWKGDEHAGFYGDAVYDDFAAFHDPRYAAFSRMLRTSFDDAVNYFADGSIDLLHIDGLHTYDAVRHDFETWHPKLSDRAVVLLHDINVRERGFGVWCFWSELRETYPAFDFIHSHGLGVLAVGPALTGPVRELCETTSPGLIAATRYRFAQAGMRCMAASEQNMLRQQLEQNKQIHSSEQAVLLQQLEQSKQSHDSELFEVRSQAQAAKTQVTALRQIENTLHNEITRLDLIAVAGEKRAAIVRARLEETTDDLTLTRARLAVTEAQLEQDGHEIAFRDLQLAERHLQIVERDALVNHFRGYEAAYNTVTQSTMWRTLGVLRSGIDKVPAPVRRALRQGVKTGLWAATPWRIPARLQRRREFFATLDLLKTKPAKVIAAPETLPEPTVITLPPPPPPLFDRFSLDHIDKPRVGYLPLIQAYDPIAPEVSIVILNWNGGDMTLLCLQHLWQHTTGHHYEIIIVDNGSAPADVGRLQAEAPLVRVIPLGGNRYFGEANNIGVEAARGRFVCLLNNDAFVSPGWLEPLVRCLDDATVGAVGPRFIYPDGSLQEAGGLISPDGEVIQLGKGAAIDDPSFAVTRLVDYVSAACVVLRRTDFIAALGFDLAWEPAYYEDVDLCLKLRLLGLSSVYCPETTVVHIENATSSNKGASLKLGNIVAINRMKFVGRWRRYLDTAGQTAPQLIPSPSVSVMPPTQAKPTRRVVIFTPYQLTPGGGERYILTVAEALKDIAQVALVTPYPVSRLRLLTMAREFELELEHLELLRPDDLIARPPADVAFVLGNEIFPTVGRMGRHNIYVCQFPFPFENQADLQRRLPFWRDFELVLTYSSYVTTHVKQAMVALNLPFRPIEVLAPPVPMIRAQAEKRRGQILHVGRFFIGGHCKRQDALIEAFRKLIEAGVEAELHFAGSVMPEPEHRAYYAGLVEQARDLPIQFHANCSIQELQLLYAESDLYWHATGVGRDIEASPHLAEHFGISVVEAMSAGCIPLVFAAGGPVSIVEDGVTGYHYDTIEDLAARTRTLLEASGEEERSAMRAATAAAAAAYSEETFRAHVRAIVTHIHPEK